MNEEPDYLANSNEVTAKVEIMFTIIWAAVAKRYDPRSNCVFAVRHDARSCGLLTLHASPK